MSFDQSAVNALFDAVVSKMLTLGVFETVNQHEPKSAPGNGIRAAVWIQSIMPVGRASGLSATSGVVTFSIRLYSNFLQQPLDGIDPGLLTATTTVMNSFTGAFTLGGTVRDIDLLGMYGQPMGAQAGYLNQDNRVYRIMTITLPVVVDDMWLQSGTVSASGPGSMDLTLDNLTVNYDATIGTLALGNPLAIAYGGTGATSSAAALAALGADASGSAATAQSNAEAYADTYKLAKANNLSDLNSASTARTNLGLGSAATSSTSAFLQPSNNLSDVGTRQTALNNLAGAVTSAQFLRGNGSNVQMAAIQAGDVPTLNQSTTGTAANITGTLDGVPAPTSNVSLNSHKITGLANGSASSDAAAFGQVPVIDSTAGDIQPLGTRAAGSTGKAADAGHVHGLSCIPTSAWPSSALAQTVPVGFLNSSTLAVASGTMQLFAIMLQAGQTVSNITFLIGTTAGTTLTHGWFALLADSTFTQLAHSADQTSGSLSASTLVTKAMTSAYTVTTSGKYWVSITVVASQQPTLAAESTLTQASAAFSAFPVAGAGSTGLTGPGTDGSTTYVTPTAAGSYAYAYVS